MMTPDADHSLGITFDIRRGVLPAFLPILAAHLLAMLLFTACQAPTSPEPITWHRDADGDGIGVAGDSQVSIMPPPGYVIPVGDCNDGNVAIFPGAREVCDRIDNNCDGQVDEGVTASWYVDEDGDGHGAGDLLTGCAPEVGISSRADDCDDADPLNYPGAKERCNGADDNCNGEVDEGMPPTDWYMDMDQDSYGDLDTLTEACMPPTDDVDWVTRAGDCNDAAYNVHPGAYESCDNLDANCNGELEDGEDPMVWYLDEDRDGVGVVEDSVVACTAPSGYVRASGDCDDLDPEVAPTLAERCDGRDNTCDGVVDENVAPLSWYEDLDGDGFGDSRETVLDCVRPDGFVARRGDCDDVEAGTHPGAPDAEGDGVDADCGGSDQAEPSVGLEASRYSELWRALAAAESGRILWVGPGVHQGGFSFAGKALTMVSTDGATPTRIEGGGASAVLYFGYGELEDTVVDGFMITGGDHNNGGGVFAISSSPTLVNNIIRENQANVGGGICLLDSSMVIENTLLELNQGENGGAISVGGDSAPVIRGCVIRHNRSKAGGGIYNGSDYRVQLIQTSLDRNDAEQGGAIYGDTESALSLNGCLVTGNTASRGGAFMIQDGALSVVGSLVLENAAGRGAGFYLAGAASVSFDLSVVAWNAGQNLYFADTDDTSSVVSSALYNPPGLPQSNLETLNPDWLQAEPGFVRHVRNGDPSDDDYHLRPDSALVDADETRVETWDGSPCDIGLYGCERQDSHYYHDVDLDGLYGGWEREHGLNPDQADGQADLDADGVTNEEELALSLEPDLADTDGDGATDGEELSAGSDPRNWYAHPHEAYPVLARIPEDFPTLQAAIGALRDKGRLELAAGTWAGGVQVAGRTLSLSGPEGAAETMIEGGGPVISACWSSLELSGLTLQGGNALSGGGLLLLNTEGTLSDLVIRSNVATHGSGARIVYGSPTFKRCEFSEHDRYDGGDGRGVFAEDSSPTFEGCHLWGNSGGPYGGGMYLLRSRARLDNCILERNSAVYGGGLCADMDDSTLTHVLIRQNVVSSYGGGVYIGRGSTTLLDTVAVVSNGNDEETSDGQGGGIYITSSSPRLRHCTLVNNLAAQGAGVFVIGEEARPQIEGSILAYDMNDTLYQVTSTAPHLGVFFTDLYNDAALPNHNLTSLDASVLTVEPGFLAYDEEGLPASLHLAKASPLVNAGDPEETDADWSRGDLGCYGGPLGAGWDLDGDGYFDWFWPGAFEDAQEGVDTSLFDVDDLDAARH